MVASPAKPEVTIYTDGAAKGNPGPAGYGTVLLYGEHRKELSAGFVRSTNNRMELLAAIVGLEALKKPCRVTLYSDSRYVVDAVEKRSVFRWRARGWWRTKDSKAKNSDLWERFLAVYEKHDVRLRWVKGHAGHEQNERCDALAVEAATAPDREVDEVYERENPLAPAGEAPPPKPSGGSSKIKHREPGEPCRKCSTPLEKRQAKEKKLKPGQTYYFPWYLFCPGCQAMYMVEEAKREVTETAAMW